MCKLMFVVQQRHVAESNGINSTIVFVEIRDGIFRVCTGLILGILLRAARPRYIIYDGILRLLI